MKLFILLTFCLTFLSAETQNFTNGDCQAVLPKKRVENELKTILHKIRSYKKEKNQQLTTLRKKVITIKDKFANYKSKKEYEIKQLKKKQIKSPTRASLNNKNRKIKELQHQLSLLQKQLSQKKKTILSLKDRLTQKSQQPILISTVTKENTPKEWIKITVNNDLNIYDLALKYYGDSQEYEKIYMANQNKIDENYQIRNGMSLKIPITENFMEQPTFINTY